MRLASLYSVLGVAPTATQEQIKAAFRAEARACHPDHHPEDPAKAERFKEVSAAYEVLSNPTARAAYDRGDFAVLPEAARVLLEKLGRGLIDGVAGGAKAQAAQFAARWGSPGKRAADIASQTIDLSADLAQKKLLDWLGGKAR